MIVQATNTGGDLAQGQFDLAIPGGGVGICESKKSKSSDGELANRSVPSQWMHR